MIKQLHCGFFSDIVKEELLKSKYSPLVDKILEELSCFEVITDLYLNNYNGDSTFSVLSNILSRGLPTRMSLKLEEIIATTFKLGTKKEINGSIVFQRANISISPIENILITLEAKNVLNIINNVETLDALQIFFTPFAIARLQKAILELLLNDVISIFQDEWNIVVIERDVPCAYLAFTDLIDQIKLLFGLQDKKIKLPKVNLKVINSNIFQNAKLNELQPQNLSIGTSKAYCDVLIDISTIDTFNSTTIPSYIIYKKYIKISNTKRENLNSRKFYTTDLITYTSAATFKNQQWIIKQAAKEKLEIFLQNIFRKSSFRDGQLAILNRTLQCKTVIGLLPTGAGKSLIYQLSSLLQPGVTLIIDPLRSLMKDQTYNLKKNKIDACLYINSDLTYEERKTAEKKMKNGEAIFIFISPERLQIPDFRYILQNMNNNNIYFSYAVIDEAHCVSEWGHDFRLSYLRLGQNTMKFCKTKNLTNLPLVGLTATASFDVLADIQRELFAKELNNEMGEDVIVRTTDIDRAELKYYVIPVETSPIFTSEWDYKEKVAITKKARINQILKTYETRNFFSSDCEKAGLIFCPHRTWHFGVTDMDTPKNRGYGIADNITPIPYLKKGIFMGTSDDDNFQKNIANISIQSQEDFIENRINILVATKAFGMGIDKPNIRFTIHVNYPNSLESFVQEAGRAGRDRERADCFILFNQQKYGNMEVDKDNLLHFHNNSFKGADYEKEIINSFLDCITYSKTSEIANLIEEKYSIEVQISIWQSNGGIWYLSLQKEPKQEYSRIMLSNLRVYSDNTIDATITNTITPLVVSYIQTNMPIANNRTRELQTVLRKKGISQHIDELKIGEKCTIHIGFRTQQVNNTFIDKLDTEKMIYRLCIIGLIDDYTVDFNNKEFIMHITKKPDHDYLKSLREYIELYYSDQVANSELRKLTTYNGTVLKKCIHFLIDFVYREIAQKRRLAIDTMKQACIEGLKDNGTQETKENGSKTFREFLDYYFRSKYARKGYQENGRNQSLSDRTMVGRYQSIECVWEFMEITKGNIENLKHLRGACLRMLQDQPKNASLLMLKSFAVFLLEGDNKNSEIIDDAIESFSNGIENFMPNFGYSEEKRDIFMDKFKSYLLMYSQNDNIITLIDEIIDGYNLHKLLNSLQKLTNSYLKDYGKY